MQNTGPKEKAGRKPKQKNALAKASAERRAASLKKITENKLLLPSVAPAKPPIPGSEKSPPCSPRPPINETEVDNVMQSTQAAPLSPDSPLCTPQPGTQPKPVNPFASLGSYKILRYPLRSVELSTQLHLILRPDLESPRQARSIELLGTTRVGS